MATFLDSQSDFTVNLILFLAFLHTISKFIKNVEEIQKMMAPNKSSSDPIPIPAHPTELHKLIRERNWPGVIERCESHPAEVGSSSHLRNERGYTALHTLMAYNQIVPGEELVPVIRALLKAAECIHYGEAHRLGDGNGGESSSVHKGVDPPAKDDDMKSNTNEVVEGQDTTATGQSALGGSWKLLKDQNNRAKWSPLHLSCVSGGVTHGKVAVLKALLQMKDDDEGDETSATSSSSPEVGKCRKGVLMLLDRQNRNALHHILDKLVPSIQSFDEVRFLADLEPMLLFQKDVFDKRPISYVLERIMEGPGTRRRHFMNNYGMSHDDGALRNYMMLKHLLRLMEKEIMKGNGGSEDNIAAIDPPDGEDEKDDAALEEQDNSEMNESKSINQTNQTSLHNNGNNNNVNSPKNLLHSACLLPRTLAPANGSLIVYLASPYAFKLEAKLQNKARDSGETLLSIDMAKQVDDYGNHALHLFLSNVTYSMDSLKRNAEEEETNFKKKQRDGKKRRELEYTIMTQLLKSDPDAASIRNFQYQLPLAIAMKTGLSSTVIAMLIVQYPQAVLLDEDLVESDQMFLHVLGCISIPPSISLMDENVDNNGTDNSSSYKEEQEKTQRQYHTTMFELLRSKPGIVALAGSEASKLLEAELEEKNKHHGMKRWFKKLNPFS